MCCCVRVLLVKLTSEFFVPVLHVCHWQFFSPVKISAYTVYALEVNFTSNVYTVVSLYIILIYSSDDLKLDDVFAKANNFSKDLSVSGTVFEQFFHDNIVPEVYVDLVDPILEICLAGSAMDTESAPQIADTSDTPKLPSPDQEFIEELVTDSNGEKG